MRTTFSLLLIALATVATACAVSLETDEPPTAPSSSAATTLPALAPLVLAADGLGGIPFGSQPDPVIAELTSRFGAPDRDTGWNPPAGLFATCPGVMVRVVGFGSFEVLFTDSGADRLPEFFAWTYGFDPATTTGGIDPRGLDLRTAEGIGLASTGEQLTAVYGARLADTSDDSGLSWSFGIDTAEPIGIRGLLSGPEPGALVTFIESAPGCGIR
jgi:hypothetical protein